MQSSKRRMMILLVMLMSLTLLTACNAASKQAFVDKGEQTALLLFNGGSSDIGVGDLYYKKGSADKEKLSDSALKNQYLIMPEKQVILFMEKDGGLYIKEMNKTKQKISDKVIKSSFSFNKAEDTILFLKENETDKNLAELYTFKLGVDKEKIASDLKYGSSSQEIQISDDGNCLMYINKEQVLYQKESNKDKEKIASDVASIQMSNVGSAYAYKNKSGAAYIKWANDIEPQKVASGSAQNIYLFNNGMGAAFIGEYNGTKQIGELYFATKGISPYKIASDVKSFKVSSDGNVIHYLNEDQVCYRKELPVITEKSFENSQGILDNLSKTEKVKIGSDLKGYEVEPYGSSVAFINADYNLYLKSTDKEKFRIATDITDAKQFQNGVLFLNKDQALMYNNKLSEVESVSSNNIKLGENVLNFLTSQYGKFIVYHESQDKAILLSTDYGTPETILENADQYEMIHYNNQLLFEKMLTYEAVLGNYYCEKLKQVYTFGKDMNFVLYDQGSEKEKTTIEQTASDVISITFKSTKSDSIVNQSQYKIIKTKDQKWKMQIGSAVYDLKILKDADKSATLAKLKKEAEDRAAKAAMEEERKARVNAAETLGRDLMYYGAYLDTYTQLYENHNFNSYNYGSYNNSAYHEVLDYWVSDDGDLWINMYANNYDYGDIYVWAYYPVFMGE